MANDFRVPDGLARLPVAPDGQIVTIWYRASIFPTQEAAHKAWMRFHGDPIWHTPGVTGLTISTFLFKGRHYFAAISDRTPSPEVAERVEHYMSAGQAAELIDEILSDLMYRRMSRRSLADADGHYENHTPSVVMSTISVTEEEHRAQLDEAILLLRERGLPFRKCYEALLPLILGGNMMQAPTYIEETIQQGVRTAECFLWTESAEAMHKAVYVDDPAFIESAHKSLWIEGESAPLFAINDRPVKVVHCFKVERIEEWAKNNGDEWMINCLAENGDHVFSMAYLRTLDHYSATIGYVCPYDDCVDESRVVGTDVIFYREPCELCSSDGTALASWLHIAIEIIQRKYAVSVDPPPFQVVKKTYSEERLVPRHHGTGAPKKKRVQAEDAYTVVAFEVAELPTALEIEEADRETRGQTCWFKIHDRSLIIYEARKVPERKRAYPTTASGERQGGEVTVKEHIHHYPMLPPYLRKTKTIRRVVASGYGQTQGEKQ